MTFVDSIFSEVTQKERDKERCPSPESENSTCATLRGHLSNSWAFVFITSTTIIHSTCMGIRWQCTIVMILTWYQCVKLSYQL